MPKVKKTIRNPYGLSTKQSLVIADIIQTAKNGERVNLTKSHAKFYKDPSQLAYQNYNKQDFRAALIAGLADNGILGKNGKVSQKLAEGLEATTETEAIDYKTRLAYIQEINKILGTYAPEKSQSQSVRFNLDIPPDQIKQKIKSLESELGK